MADVDIFAKIADSYKENVDRGLIAPSPEPISDENFFLNDRKEGVFSPTPKMNSKEELEEELKRMEEEIRPFLRDFAPEIKTRPWHFELVDFLWSLDGEEKQKVKIPHYGGKIGKHKAVYETVFCLPEYEEKRVILTFRGVDYIARVFVNGEFAGSHEGFFAPFEMDVTTMAHPGENHLRVEVLNDYVQGGSDGSDGSRADGNKIYAATGPGWDDPDVGWHHCPPGMGIFQRVYVELRNNEYITDVFVRQGEELWIECYGSEIREKPVAFEVSVYGQNFRETVFEHVRMEPYVPIGTGKNGKLTEAEFQSGGSLYRKEPLLLGNGFNCFKFPLQIPNKRLWSPEKPYLYQVQVSMLVEGKTVSAFSRQFGIRSFIQDTEHSPKGMFYLNGEKIRLRGANTMGFEQQCVMRGDMEQLLKDMLLAKICHMNFLRLTQRPVQEEIYELCDRVGLMIQTDLPLFGSVRINQMAEVIRQAGEMEHLIRSHACCILVTYINEPSPNANHKPHRMLPKHSLEEMYHAADSMVRLYNPDRVIKYVDGDYDPPCDSLPDNHCYTMWYNGHGIDLGKLHKGYWMEIKPGWCWGCGEFGTEGLDYAEVMLERYPKEWCAPPFHPDHIKNAQTGNFYHFFFEKADSMEEWIAKSQRHQAFATKLMTNALRRNNGNVSFAIHLFIDAWPDGWMKSIMDCRRFPKPAYYVYRDCLTPLKADLRSDRFTYWGGEELAVESRICNDKAALDGAVLRFMVYVDGEFLSSGEFPAKIETCRTTYQGMIRVRLPEVTRRCKAVVYMGIVKDGELLHWTSEEYEVFPRKECHMPERISMEDYEDRKAQIEEALSAGAVYVFGPLSPGVYEIAGHTVTAMECGKKPVYFVSRRKGHPLVNGFEEGDFSYWYDEREDRLTPMAYATISVPGGEPVLLSANKTGKGDWTHDCEEAEICSLFSVGKGKVVICQIDLDKGEKNPACALFADRIAGLADHSV